MITQLTLKTHFSRETQERHKARHISNLERGTEDFWPKYLSITSIKEKKEDFWIAIKISTDDKEGTWSGQYDL